MDLERIRGGWEGGEADETGQRPFKHWPRPMPVAFRVFGKVGDTVGQSMAKTTDVEKACIWGKREGKGRRGSSGNNEWTARLTLARRRLLLVYHNDDKMTQAILRMRAREISQMNFDILIIQRPPSSLSQ